MRGIIFIDWLAGSMVYNDKLQDFKTKLNAKRMLFVTQKENPVDHKESKIKYCRNANICSTSEAVFYF